MRQKIWWDFFCCVMLMLMDRWRKRQTDESEEKVCQNRNEGDIFMWRNQRWSREERLVSCRANGQPACHQMMSCLSSVVFISTEDQIQFLKTCSFNVLKPCVALSLTIRCLWIKHLKLTGGTCWFPWRSEVVSLSSASFSSFCWSASPFLCRLHHSSTTETTWRRRHLPPPDLPPSVLESLRERGGGASVTPPAKPEKCFSKPPEEQTSPVCPRWLGAVVLRSPSSVTTVLFWSRRLFLITGTFRSAGSLSIKEQQPEAFGGKTQPLNIKFQLETNSFSRQRNRMEKRFLFVLEERGTSHEVKVHLHPGSCRLRYISVNNIQLRDNCNPQVHC